MDENNQETKDGAGLAFKTPNDGEVSSNNQPQNIFEDIQNKQEVSVNNAPDPRLTINSIDDSGMPETLESEKAEVLPTTNYSENPPQPQPIQQDGAPVATAPTGVTTSQNSQQGSNDYLQSADVPEEVKKWNWGAFLLSWIWGVGNGVWISLIALIPAANLVMSIILGIKGGEWAWKTGKFSSIEQFQKTQRAWSIWGIVLFVISIVVSIGVLVSMVLLAVNGAREKQNDAIKVNGVRSIVSAIYEYRAKNDDSCPKNLDILAPEYIKSLPKTSQGESYTYKIQDGVCIVSVKLSDMDSTYMKDDYIKNNGETFDMAAESIESFTEYQDTDNNYQSPDI